MKLSPDKRYDNLSRSLCSLLPLTLFAAAMALAACSDSDDPSDASTPLDGSTSRDATSGSDASTSRDATTGRDASVADATEPDAEAPTDAEAPDAEPNDVGTSSIADAGTADAGSDPDAGPTDSGCVLGEVSSTATTSNLDLFGTPAYFNGGNPVPAGTYRITYIDGCMKYASYQGWTVNAYAANQACWYVIGANTSERIVVPPGTIGYSVGAGAYADFEDCVNASLQVPPVEFTLAQPTPLGVWLFDSPYSDNIAGLDNRNPTWRLSVVTSTCGP